MESLFDSLLENEQQPMLPRKRIVRTSVVRRTQRKRRDPDLQPTLPGDFESPPPECSVRGADHVWVEIKAYIHMSTYPAAAYEPFCSYCGKSKKGTKSVDDAESRTRSRVAA